MTTMCVVCLIFAKVWITLFYSCCKCHLSFWCFALDILKQEPLHASPLSLDTYFTAQNNHLFTNTLFPTY